MNLTDILVCLLEKQNGRRNNMSDIIIGILLVISFFFMVWYCVKGYNLMVGFAIMATVWMGLALVGTRFRRTRRWKDKE